MQHLAVFKKNALDSIFRGEKTVESRFSLSKIPPYGTIQEGDEIFLKESGGKVLGKMRAGKIKSFYNLIPAKVKKIAKDFNRRVGAGKGYWKEKEKSHYGTLIEIKNPIRFRAPFEIRKHDRRPWITLRETEMPLDKSQLAIRFGASDSLGALKGLLEKYAAPKRLKEESLLRIMKAVGDLADKNSLKKLSQKEKKEIESSLAQILVSLLILSSKYDLELYEAALKEISRKEKYSLEKLKEL